MPSPVRQASAIPVRDGLLCMVTSRSRQRWVFPKGRIEVRQTPQEAALMEAWEEAGLIGTLQDTSLGHYHYEKYGTLYKVEVFLMCVVESRDDWPEQSERTRQWISVSEALRRVEEPDLKAMLRTAFLEPLLPASA